MATSQSKCVPPSRRAGYIPSSSSALPPSATRHRPSRARAHPEGFDIDTLLDIFQHPQGSTLTWFAYPPKDPPAEPTYASSTSAPSAPVIPSLSARTASPPPPPAPLHPLRRLISYITIFPRAHPLWEDDHELWSHSQMEKLIADWEGPKKNFGRPIPVINASKKRRSRARFAGWWMIDSIHVVEPRSTEVSDMMKIKEKSGSFSRSGRTAQAWDQSLSYTWVRIRLSKCTKEGLKDPTALGKGQGGKYVLVVGGMKEEMKVLEWSAKGEEGLPDLAALNVADVAADGEVGDEKE